MRRNTLLLTNAVNGVNVDGGNTLDRGYWITADEMQQKTPPLAREVEAGYVDPGKSANAFKVLLRLHVDQYCH